MIKTLMKRMCAFLWQLAFAAIFVACSGGDDAGNSVPQVKIPEAILRDGMTFSKTGGSMPLNIQSNLPPVVMSSDTWCKVLDGTSNATSIYKYTIAVDVNNESDDRETTVTISVGGSEQGRFTVKQTEGDVIIVGKAELTLDTPEAGTFEVELVTNGEPQVTVNDFWLKEVETRAREERTYMFVAEGNYGVERSATITFTLGTVTETVTIVQPEGKGEGDMSSDARTLAGKMYAGINIGNTLEACDSGSKTASETLWGNPKITEAYIKALKAQGFNAVRLPCAWDYYIIDAATHRLDPEWLERVSEVVGYCVQNDMYVMLNIHWDGGWLEESVSKGYDEKVDAKQHALWTQIASKLNVYDEHLLFAGCNEPGQQDQGNFGNSGINALLKYEQTFVDAVRATGGNNAVRCLVVQGPYTNIDRTVSDYVMPTDKVADRLLVEVHYYDPWNFTGMDKDEDWGNMFWYWGKENHVSGSPHNANWGEEDHVKAQFKKMKEAYADKGIPAIVGEYSTMIRTNTDNPEMHAKSRAHWNEVVTREAKDAGCVPFYWETGGDMDRQTGEPKEPAAIEGILKGAEAGKYPF